MQSDTETKAAPHPAVTITPCGIEAAIDSIPPGLYFFIDRYWAPQKSPLYSIAILSSDGNTQARAEHDDCATAIHMAVAMLAAKAAETELHAGAAA